MPTTNFPGLEIQAAVTVMVLTRIGGGLSTGFGSSLLVAELTMTAVAEINAAAHPNAARVITEQLASCPFDGGPGASISFELPEERCAGVNAWIDPETLTGTEDMSHPSMVGEGASR